MADKPHTGLCGHCGASVPAGVNKCFNCSAVWKPEFPTFGKAVAIMTILGLFVSVLMLSRNMAVEGLVIIGACSFLCWKTFSGLKWFRFR